MCYDPNNFLLGYGYDFDTGLICRCGLICVDFKMEIEYILHSPKFCKRVDMKINAFFP